MMRARAAILVLAAAGAGAFLAAPPGGTTFVETFDNNSNVGSWTFGNSFESITQDGANRGFHLRNVNLDTIAPQPRTATGVTSVFTGDYRARGVTSVGADLRVYRVDFTSRQRPVSVILESDAGTPGDPADDCSVYFLGSKSLPPPGRAWMTYDFAVDSASPVMPAGWNVIGGSCAGLAPDAAWNLVIQDVDQLAFFGADPALFYIFQVWDVGLDNPRITLAAP